MHGARGSFWAVRLTVRLSGKFKARKLLPKLLKPVEFKLIKRFMWSYGHPPLTTHSKRDWKLKSEMLI